MEYKAYKDLMLRYKSADGMYKLIMDGFCKFSPAYTISNECLSEAMEILKPQGKSVLTVAGSGDQAFFYKIYGALHVDTFDISYCAKVMMDVKTAAVQNLRCGEYKKFLDSIESAAVNIPDVPEYKKISSDLSGDVKDFMNDMRGVAYRLNSSYNFNVMTARQYRKLRNSIKAPFNFIWSDIMELSGRLTRKYDQVYLSNIFQYNYHKKDENVKLIQDLLMSLNDGGEIMFFLTPFIRPHEKDALRDIAKSLEKFVQIRIEKTHNQQYVIMKKL